MNNPYKSLKYHEEKEIIPRRCCTDDRLKQLREAGFETLGYEKGLEDILTEKGFGLPVKDEEYYTFMVNHKYMRFYFNYADCLAEEILLLRKLNLI
jgi:hypothetical protein